MEVKKTIVTIFFVPTLSIPKDELKNNQFINGYIKDSHRDVQYDNAICLLFKPTNLDRFRVFLDSEYERTKSIIEDYDYKDGFVVVVYKLNPDFKVDFNLIKEGKYSKTSPSFQALFLRVVKIMKNGLHRDEISLQYRIFNKTQDLVQFWEDKFNINFSTDQEVWSGYREDEEILDISKFKELVL